MPLKLRACRRLQWLSACIALNVIAASAIAAYEEALAAAIAIAAFLTMDSDVSGRSGFQAVAVSMCELSLGLVIGVALALNAFVAVSIGGIVPLVLKRAVQDPAAASGPLLTTITDIARFFLVLSFCQRDDAVPGMTPASPGKSCRGFTPLALCRPLRLAS